MQKNKINALDKKVIKRLAVGAIVGNMVTALLLFGTAIAIWKGTLPEDTAAEASMLCVMLGAMASGRMTAGKGRGGWYGFIGGMAWLTAATLIAFYREQMACFSLDYIKYAICAIAGGGFGGVISTGSTGKKNKKNFLRKRKYTNCNH